MTTTERPGIRDGVQSEFTLIFKAKPGHEAALREAVVRSQAPEGQKFRRQAYRQLATLHNARFGLIDNDTRFFFASVFDGEWDTYIEGFAATPFFVTAFDDVLQHVEGYPTMGMKDPAIKDFFVANQVPMMVFNSVYPDLTVQQIWKQQRAYDALQAVLDTPEFQAAVKNPDYAKLLATPAFQKLLDEAAG